MVQSRLTSILDRDPRESELPRGTTKLSPQELASVRRLAALLEGRPSSPLHTGRIISPSRGVVNRITSPGATSYAPVEITLPTDTPFELGANQCLSAELNPKQFIARRTGDIFVVPAGTTIRCHDGAIELVESPRDNGSLPRHRIRIFGKQLYPNALSEPIRFDGIPGIVSPGTLIRVANAPLKGGSGFALQLEEDVQNDLSTAA